MNNNKECLTDFVIVSAAAPNSEPETYIFPANREGKALNMIELSGSFKGELNHVRALENAGYKVHTLENWCNEN